MEFVIENNNIREILQHSLYVAEKIPVLSMLLSAGMHTYILLGECIYLMAKKKRRGMLVLVPALCVLAICMVSPVNAYLRYIMPVMAMLPVTAGWCFALNHNEALYQKGENT